MTTTEPIRVCKRCGTRYHWEKSPSASLKMTYCGSLCEHADLGFTIEALLRSEPGPSRLAVVAGGRTTITLREAA